MLAIRVHIEFFELKLVFATTLIIDAFLFLFFEGGKSFRESRMTSEQNVGESNFPICREDECTIVTVAAL